MGMSDWGEAAHQTYNHAAQQRQHQTREQVFTSRGLDPALDPRLKRDRESRDSAAHPESNAIGVFFDETSSMGDHPERFAKVTLGRLMRLLVDRGFIPHPQVLVGAIGDARNREVAPLQLGEFESGIEIDQWLTKIFLEALGGGQAHESYELPLYWAARHTFMDCLEKRGKKGYLFLIGDEMPYPEVRKADVSRVLGEEIDQDIPLSIILDEACEKFEVFFIHIASISYGPEHDLQTLARWQELLGAHCIHLDEPDDICELIGTVIGCHEGRGIDTVVSGLRDSGASSRTITAMRRIAVPLERQMVAVSV